MYTKVNCVVVLQKEQTLWLKEQLRDFCEPRENL